MYFKIMNTLDTPNILNKNLEQKSTTSRIGLEVAKLVPTLANLLPVAYIGSCIFLLNHWYQDPFQSKSIGYSHFLFALCIIELCFYTYLRYSNYQINSKPIVKHSIANKPNLQELIDNLTASTDDVSQVIKGYFGLDTKNWPPNHPITLTVAREFFSLGLANCYYDDLNKEERLLVENHIQHPKLKDIPNDPIGLPPNLTFLTHFKVPFQFIPLTVYGFLGLLKIGCNSLLKYWEFERYYVPGISHLGYWIKHGNANQEESPPIIFCHGAVAGNWGYLPFIYQIVKHNPHRTIILFHSHTLSLDLVSEPPSTEEHLKFFDHLFQTHQLSRANWCGHSFGTFILGMVACSRPQYVNSIIFIDPVCFNLFVPHMAYHLCFSPLTSATHVIIRYFGAMEYSLARLIYRHFRWDELIYLPTYSTKYPGKTYVFLAEYDEVVNCKSNFNYLTQSNQPKIVVEVMKNLRHAEFMVQSDFTKKILKCI